MSSIDCLCGKITDAGIAKLAHCHILDLSNCDQITDAGIMELANCHKVFLMGCRKITKVGVDELRKKDYSIFLMYRLNMHI